MWEESTVYEALQANDAEKIKTHVNKEEISATNKDGLSYLHAAVTLQCSKDVITALLPHVSLAQRDYSGRTAFHYAVDAGNGKLAAVMSD